MYPAGIYLLKVNNRNNRTRFEDLCYERVNDVEGYEKLNKIITLSV